MVMKVLNNNFGNFMNNKYTAVIKQDGDWWFGWTEEIPGVNCQEATHDELIETLKITLQEALVFNREEALLNYREEPIPEKTPLDKLRLNIDMTNEEIDKLFVRKKTSAEI
jgi:predicted RNase H-like HicB family nuclease